MLLEETIRCTGTVTQLHAKSGDNWSRFEFTDIDGKRQWAVAKWRVLIGEIVDFEGVFDKKYKSWNAVRLVESTTISNEVVCLHLINNLPGVGKAKAAKLSKKFENLFDAVVKSPETISEECGAAIEDVREIVAQLEETQRSLSRVSTLINKGFPKALAYKISSIDAHYVIAVRCPYEAIKHVEGLGWKIADEIGRKNGIPLDSETRIVAAIEHYYTDKVEGEGHTLVYTEALLHNNALPALLGCYPDTLERIVGEELIPVEGDKYTSKKHHNFSQIIADFVLN